MTQRKRQQFGISLSETEVDSLDALSIEHGALWGENSNISALIRMIANKELLLYRPGDCLEEKSAIAFLEKIKSLEELIVELKNLVEEGR